jgi:hypothetical protein
MMQSWIGERMAEEHRRALTTLIRAENRPSIPSGEPVVVAPRQIPNTRLAADSRPASHRPIGRQLGALLIRAGTRLGGASVSPS